MQLSLFAEAERIAAAVPGVTRREPPRTLPALAAVIAQSQDAHTPDGHAVAVDAVFRLAAPRIAWIAQLFIPAWPHAHVEAEDLTQEILLDVAASLPWAPCASDAQSAAWLSALAFQELHTRWRAAHEAALEQHVAESEFASALQAGDAPDDAGQPDEADADDEDLDERDRDTPDIARAA